MSDPPMLCMNYGVFRLSLFCISQRLPTLVFCVASCVVGTNIRNAQSCCERLASADIDRCTAMKSECTIRVLHIYVEQEDCDKIIHFCFDFDVSNALTLLFCAFDASKSQCTCISCHSSLTKVNMQLIYK